MADSPEDNTQQSSIDDRQFPLGLSSRQFFVLVIIGAIVIPGLLVGIFEAAGFSIAGDFIWIIGYGTGIFVVWYLWLRPLDLVGPAEQDTSATTDERPENEESQDTAGVSNSTQSSNSN